MSVLTETPEYTLVVKQYQQNLKSKIKLIMTTVIDNRFVVFE